MADSPFYRFFRRLTVPMPFDTWRKLPRFPTHKNEYWDGAARYTPRLNSCDIYLDLAQWKPPPHDDEFVSKRMRVAVRQLKDEDWEELPGAFHAAFCQQQPLASWRTAPAARAARCTINWTRSGGDGLLVRDACFTAWDLVRDDASPEDVLAGAAIVTLVPYNHLREPPAEASVPHPEKHDVRVVAHLTWIFVRHRLQRQNVGTLLLEDVVSALRTGGFRWLSSTCLLDHRSSLLWHWRNGFQLPPNRLQFHALRSRDEAIGLGSKSVEGVASSGPADSR